MPATALRDIYNSGKLMEVTCIAWLYKKGHQYLCPSLCNNNKVSYNNSQIIQLKNKAEK